MAAEWIEKVSGSIGQKKQYRQYKARVPRWLGVARRDRLPAEPGTSPDWREI